MLCGELGDERGGCLDELLIYPHRVVWWYVLKMIEGLFTVGVWELGVMEMKLVMSGWL